MVFSQEDKAARQLIRRLRGTGTVHLEPDADLILIGEQTRRVFSSEAGRDVQLPPSGVCYAVYTGEMPFQLGLGQLGSYTVKEYPGHRFPLGLYGTMRLSVAHVIGLRTLLGDESGLWRETLTVRQFFDALDKPLREGVVQAADAVCGGQEWAYETLLSGMKALTDEVFTRWFRSMYDHGLLLDRRTFELGGITPPTVEE